jgi:hypothetical protein
MPPQVLLIVSLTYFAETPPKLTVVFAVMSFDEQNR